MATIEPNIFLVYLSFKKNVRRRRGGGAYSRKAVLYNALGCGRLLERGRLFEKMRYSFINPTIKFLGVSFILCDHYISDTDPPASFYVLPKRHHNRNYRI